MKWFAGPAGPLKLLLLLSLGLMLAVRIAGPSALHRFDQPKTVAYTASMVLHHEWLMPNDTLGRLSTKPPLVNWLAAPVVAAGFWTEWAVKLPMLLGSLLTLWITIKMGQRLLARCPETAPWAEQGGIIAGLAWLTTPGTMDSIYHCRPDPFLVACLVSAWAFATLCMMEGEAKTWMKVGLWVSTGLAGLTKGPPALLPMLFVPLAALLIAGNRRFAQQSGWRWGIPLALGIVGIWLVPAAIYHGDHFFKVLLGQELLSRVAGVGAHFGDTAKGGGTSALLLGIYKNPAWFMQKMLPWSLATVAGLWIIRPRNWLRHPLAPAVVWVFLVLAFFSLTAGKTADYILPAYPVAAILAAYACVRSFGLWKLNAAAYGCAGLALAILLSVQALYFSSAATNPLGDNVKSFANAVALKAGQEPVAFVQTGYNTLEFFLHRHQPGDPSAAQLKAASWIVMPVVPDLQAVIVSDKLPGLPPGFTKLALYRADDKVLQRASELLNP